MTIALLCIASLVVAWAVVSSRRPRSPGNIQQRASREDLDACARIAARRVAQLNGDIIL